MNNSSLDDEGLEVGGGAPQSGREKKARVDALVRLIAFADAVAFAVLVLLAIFLPEQRTTFLIVAGAFVVGATVGILVMRRAMYRTLDDPALR